jgi:hypothetical protein
MAAPFRTRLASVDIAGADLRGSLDERVPRSNGDDDPQETRAKCSSDTHVHTAWLRQSWPFSPRIACVLDAASLFAFPAARACSEAVLSADEFFESRDERVGLLRFFLMAERGVGGVVAEKRFD